MAFRKVLAVAKHAVNHCSECQQYFEISKSYRAPWFQARFGVLVCSPASVTGGGGLTTPVPLSPQGLHRAANASCSMEEMGQGLGSALGVGLQDPHAHVGGHPVSLRNRTDLLISLPSPSQPAQPSLENPQFPPLFLSSSRTSSPLAALALSSIIPHPQAEPP